MNSLINPYKSPPDLMPEGSQWGMGDQKCANIKGFESGYGPELGDGEPYSGSMYYPERAEHLLELDRPHSQLF
jgi:hypothetical protein